MNNDTDADSFNGADGDDSFTFDGSVNGGDTIDGGLGTDTVTGSSNNDILNITALSGIESIDFGAGDDGFIIGAGVSLGGVSVDLGSGTDYIGARVDGTLDLSAYTLGVDILGLEYITDNSGAETIIGTDQADTIYLQADASSDIIYGNDGSDIIMLLGELTSVDNLADFDVTEGDALDISDIISFDSGDGDLIEDFIRLTDIDGDPADGSGTVTLSIDVDGVDNGTSYQDYFVFADQGVDLATLISNGNLVVE